MRVSLCLLMASIFGTVPGSGAELTLKTIGYCYNNKNCNVPSDPSVTITPKVSLAECVCLVGKNGSFGYLAGKPPSPVCVNIDFDAKTGKFITSKPFVPKEKRALRALQEGVVVDPKCDSVIIGEPHIKQLLGGWFDYHGECDLVFANAPDFGNGRGLDIHARTTIRYDYSYIESGAIRIGSDILEVAGYGQYLLNGISNADLTADTLSGFTVTHDRVSDQQHVFTLDVGNGNIFSLDTMKDIVSIKVQAGGGFYGPEMHAWFDNSTGLLGSLSTSQMVARNGTVLTDVNDFGQEWQVLDTEPKLFMFKDRTPQYPQKCILRDAHAKDSRRLGQTISREDAELACKSWDEDEKEACIYDVMATGDLELATAGGY